MCLPVCQYAQCDQSELSVEEWRRVARKRRLERMCHLAQDTPVCIVSSVHPQWLMNYRRNAIRAQVIPLCGLIKMALAR